MARFKEGKHNRWAAASCDQNCEVQLSYLPTSGEIYAFGRCSSPCSNLRKLPFRSTVGVNYQGHLIVFSGSF